MRKIFKVIGLMGLLLATNGCSVIDALEERATKNKSERAFDSMCNRYDLAICGDDVPVIEYSYADIDDVIMYSYNKFYSDSEYVYKYDSGEKYDYMFVDENNEMHGDCEDWVITFIEDCIRNGLFKRGEVEWVFGELGGNGHAWAIVTKDGEQYLFDNGFKTGIELATAYGSDQLDYEEMFVVYQY